MTEIILENISKKFSGQLVFQNLNLRFESDKIYAIVGENGSGKSTLLSLLSGYLSQSSGKVSYLANNKAFLVDDIANNLSISAPYLELIEELTLDEMIDFHFAFCSYLPGYNKDSLIGFMNLEQSKNKYIQKFSSGMKQRLKLGLAVFSDKPILLLDEPTSNLDAQGINWYKTAIVPLFKNRLVVISSNQKHEYDFADSIIDINHFKGKNNAYL